MLRALATSVDSTCDRLKRVLSGQRSIHLSRGVSVEGLHFLSVGGRRDAEVPFDEVSIRKFIYFLRLHVSNVEHYHAGRRCIGTIIIYLLHDIVIKCYSEILTRFLPIFCCSLQPVEPIGRTRLHCRHWVYINGK